MTTADARRLPWNSQEPQPPIRVLVVDDYAEVRAVIAKILDDAGYIVTCAASGEEALQVITTNPDAADLLVTDLDMPPGMPGDELARRAQVYRPALRVLMMTGQPVIGTEGICPTALHSGMLRKPFSPAELLAAVRSVLARETVPSSARPSQSTFTERYPR